MKKHGFTAALAALLLAAALLLGTLPAAVLADAPKTASEDDITVVISVEGLTLGQGIYIKPKAYTLDRINELIARDGYAPCTEDNITAGMATLAFLNDNGLEYGITGKWERDAYVAKIKGLDTGVYNIPKVVTENGGPSNEDAYAENNDEWLGEFDFDSMSGWMITVNDLMIPVGSSAWKLAGTQGRPESYDLGNTYVVRWQFTLHGYGADLGVTTGWGNTAYFNGADKAPLYAAYAKCGDAAKKREALKVMEDLTASQRAVGDAVKMLAEAPAPEPSSESPAEETPGNTRPPETPKHTQATETPKHTQAPETPQTVEPSPALQQTPEASETAPAPGTDAPDGPQTSENGHGTEGSEADKDYKSVLDAALDGLLDAIPEPAFGTTAGEWTVLALARSGRLGTDAPYFEEYYKRILNTVKETDAGLGMDGALHKSKSTENSRLILALAAIGRDPADVGGVDLIGAYEKNGMDWIKKQGLNGPVFALIALDAGDYAPNASELRGECVKYILESEIEGGGWALTGNVPDPDMTAMTLQALANYADNADVLRAAERGFAVLSELQQPEGGFASWGSVNSESISQVIVACTAWGIDPRSDARFVKNGVSAVDALLKFYLDDERAFAHVLVSGGGYVGGETDAMATDQAVYALTAYYRYANGMNSLYDMSDVKTAGNSAEAGNADGTPAAAWLIPVCACCVLAFAAVLCCALRKRKREK